MMNKVNILSIYFTNFKKEDFLRLVSDTIKSNNKITVSFPNVYICNYSFRNKSFNVLLNKFDSIIPDGIGVFIASVILYGKDHFKQWLVSTDFWVSMVTNSHHYKIFLIGGVFDCSKRIKDRYSLVGSFDIVGSLFKINNPASDIEAINKSGADILMVALGTPYQEEWIIQNKDKVNVPVIIAVGSGLDFLAGVKKRAPLWMQKIGLEWLYRLFQEPKRLWKRYIIGIPVFMFNIILIKVKLMFNKEST